MAMINKIQGILASSFLAAAMFFMPGQADALEIKQFDKMSTGDQARYTQLLIGQSIQHFWAQGNKEQGDKIMTLFRRSDTKTFSKGMNEYFLTLDALRQEEAKGNLSRVPHVEDAMRMVYLDNGIEKIPKENFMQFAKDFQPQDEGIAKDKNNKAPSGPSASVPGADDMKLARK